ncbi:hypothetical protein NMY22_g18328 [Coprinellus aureogranulatus]|nr:hypothetical protein NMY22_g18328 [Coprinellus aureogranulatus]
MKESKTKPTEERDVNPEGNSLKVQPLPAPQTEPSQVIRVFVDPECPPILTNVIQRVRRTTEDRAVVWTDGSCHDNGLETAASGSGLWYSPNDHRNRAIRVPRALPQTNNTGELLAVLVAIQTHCEDSALRVRSDSQYAIDVLGKRVAGWFREGFAYARNKEIVQALTGELMRTGAEIELEKVKGHSGDAGNDGADALANEGALREDDDIVSLDLGVVIKRAGAEISALSQALAYKTIRAAKQAPTRRRTRVMVETTLAAVEDWTGTIYTTEALWRSLNQRRGATLTQKFSAWAWKTLHMGYKVGAYWRHIVPERVSCGQCVGEPDENMAHILCECRVSHQEEIWALAKSMWDRTGLEWPPITIGLILGIGLIEVKKADGKPDQGRTRLLRILVSESAYLAWVLRCEWRIGRDADPTKLHTAEEVEARWRNTITRRLRIDWALTNRRAYGKKALHRALIMKTWEGLTASEVAAPPEGGSLATGVLVGSAQPRRLPGRNR